MVKLTLELPDSHVTVEWESCDKVVKVHPNGRSGPSMTVEPRMDSLRVLNVNIRGGIYPNDYRILQDVLQTIGNRVRHSESSSNG